MKTDFRIVSLNLKTAKSADSNTQREREPKIAEFVASSLPDSIGTQECEVFWRERLDAVLAPNGYERAQATVTDGVTKNYIWYRTATLEVVDSGVFWLSETPEKSSKGFGSRFYISCCYAEYRVKSTGERFLHFNTHLNVDSEEIRLKELAVLFSYIDRMRAESGLPVVLTGDFNSRNDTVTYKETADRFIDSRLAAKETTDTGTFNNFDYEAPYRGIIDFCFITPDVKAVKYDVFDKLRGEYISDHNAVIADLEIGNN